jgi:DNA-3-methyladenine glycosylase
MMREMVDSSQGRMELLDAAFFARPADRVARDLIGARLAVRRPDGIVERHLVFETEAYLGAHDLACHGARGRTARNAVMFGPAGCWYVYLCYGLHWMLNIVTGPEGVPAAVLIRGVGDHTGPGRLTRALGIDRAFDGRPATRSVGLWLEAAGSPVPRRLVRRTPRIGVGYAGEWAEKPLRYVVDPAELLMMEGRVACRAPVRRRS